MFESERDRKKRSEEGSGVPEQVGSNASSAFSGRLINLDAGLLSPARLRDQGFVISGGVSRRDRAAVSLERSLWCRSSFSGAARREKGLSATA